MIRVAQASLSRLMGFGACLMMIGCAEVPIGVADAQTARAETPEDQLALQSVALQRTVLEGAMAGAAGGLALASLGGLPEACLNGAGRRGGRGLLGGPLGPVLPGISPDLAAYPDAECEAFVNRLAELAVAGAATGAVAGTYVGYLQQAYATDEARLARLRADIDATNAETEAAIGTMRVVLERQGRELATAGAPGTAPPDRARAVAAAQANLRNMRRAVSGADARRAAFSEARSLVAGAGTGVDGQIAELGTRIAEMRQIADTLAEEI